MGVWPCLPWEHGGRLGPSVTRGREDVWRALPPALLQRQLDLSVVEPLTQREPEALGVGDGLADSGGAASSLITVSPDFPKLVRGPAQGSPWLGGARSGGQVAVTVASGLEKNGGRSGRGPRRGCMGEDLG